MDSSKSSSENLKDADVRSDMFSLGRLVQWLATGEPPTPAQPGNLPAGHPLAAFVNATTRLDREARPRSVEESLSLLGDQVVDVARGLRTSGGRDAASAAADVNSHSSTRRPSETMSGAPTSGLEETIAAVDSGTMNLTGSPADLQKHCPQIRLESSVIEDGPKQQVERDKLLSYAREQENLYKHFFQQGRKMGVAPKNRVMWIGKARIAAESCASACRSAGDEVAALRWEQTAKGTIA